MIEGEDRAVADWLGARAEKVIETSCARIFLTGDTAFKVKRPVDYGYLDFSTLERRRWALERELAFNRDQAPDIYRAVRRVTRGPGGLAFDGAGEVVEYALEMRRFDDRAVLAAQPQAIDAVLAERLGRTIADFHIAAPLRPGGGGARALGYAVASNAEQLRGVAHLLGEAPVGRLVAAVQAELDKVGPLLDARAAGGFARRCHGDLHLGNILLEAGRPVLFDCIEFNDLLCEIDVQYDLAFILMDLDFRGRRDAAARLLAAYLDQAARHFTDGLVEGLQALPLMLAVRAGVRAHVSARGGETAQARAYAAAALAHIAPPPPRLLAIGGRSGSGKSTLARLIAPRLGASPGALVLRTDEIRKQLFGAAPGERLPPDAYAAAPYAQVYDALFAAAMRALRAGRAVILDATFLDPELRARAEGAAREAGAPFEGFWLEAPADRLRARIEARAGDVSDATVATLESQLVREPGTMDWTILDASGPPEALARRWPATEGPGRAVFP